MSEEAGKPVGMLMTGRPYAEGTPVKPLAAPIPPSAGAAAFFAAAFGAGACTDTDTDTHRNRHNQKHTRMHTRN